MTRSYLVVGLGNPLFGDDAIAPLLAESLSECNVNALNAELDAFTAASYIENIPLVIFIDIFDSSYGNLGEIVKVRLDPRRLSREELTHLISRETGAHMVTPAHVVALAYASGKFNGDAWVIGPIVEEIRFGQPPTHATINTLDKILDELEKIISIKIDKGCVKKKFEEKRERLANFALL